MVLSITYTHCAVVNGKVLPVMYMVSYSGGNVDTSPIDKVIIKEVMRITDLNKIQLVMIKNNASNIIKQETSLSVWQCIFSDLILPLI